MLSSLGSAAQGMKAAVPWRVDVSTLGHSCAASGMRGACAPRKSRCMCAQEAMEEDAAPLALAPGRAKADSLAVLLGQALRAGDQALLEKCAPLQL